MYRLIQCLIVAIGNAQRVVARLKQLHAVRFQAVTLDILQCPFFTTHELAVVLDGQAQYDRRDPFGIVHCRWDRDVEMLGDFCGYADRYAAMPEVAVKRAFGNVQFLANGAHT